MLTAKQHELLHFIQERLDASGISPSFEEMKEALGLKSKSGIHRLISALEERGFLRRLPNRARALEVLKVPEAAKPAVRNDRDNIVPLRKPVPALRPIAANDVVEIPLHGKIAAGVPIEAFEDHNNLAVPAALLGNDYSVVESRALEFKCRCGRERALSVLSTLGAEDVEKLADEQSETEVRCSYCNSAYVLVSDDLRELAKRMREDRS